MKLSFEKIEEIIGSKLSRVAYIRYEFWFRRRLNTISQCWLHNCYYITVVNFKKERVTIQLEVTNKKTVNVDIPDCIANRRIPVEATHELENYYQYLVKSTDCNLYQKIVKHNNNYNKANDNAGNI